MLVYLTPLLRLEADGSPLAVCIAGANVPDISLLASTLEAIVVKRPTPSEQHPQHLCLDRGYENRTGYALRQMLGYTPHLCRFGQEKQVDSGHKTLPARRLVVERTFSWLSRCRAILVRWDKKTEFYLAQVKLACALLWFQRLHWLQSDALQGITNVLL